MSWEFISEMRPNSHSPSLEVSDRMASVRRSFSKDASHHEHVMRLPGQVFRASPTTSLMCWGHSSILHAR